MGAEEESKIKKLSKIVEDLTELTLKIGTLIAVLKMVMDTVFR